MKNVSDADELGLRERSRVINNPLKGLEAGANTEGAAMNRLCLTIACLSAVAWTQASAQDLSPDPLKPVRSHAPKAKHPVAVKSASLDAVHFSDPYAPPEGTTLVRRSALPGYSYPVPREPQGGLSISMGQDQGGHTTGGLKWGF
jgi:hypothetical protein